MYIEKTEQSELNPFNIHVTLSCKFEKIFELHYLPFSCNNTQDPSRSAKTESMIKGEFFTYSHFRMSKYWQEAERTRHLSNLSS